MNKNPENLMLHCPSCSRSSDNLENNDLIVFNEVLWCPYCAKIEHNPEGKILIPFSSPGRMSEVNLIDPLDAWIDCFNMTPKQRILVKNAKQEIQRAWQLWDGDKTEDMAMFKFFSWLNRHRPYFLTFRCRGDPWQKIQSWLIQYEANNR